MCVCCCPFLGYIISFNVGINKATTVLAKSKGVKIISHNVIYKLLDLLKVLNNVYVEYSGPCITLTIVFDTARAGGVSATRLGRRDCGGSCDPEGIQTDRGTRCICRRVPSKTRKACQECFIPACQRRGGV